MNYFIKTLLERKGLRGETKLELIGSLGQTILGQTGLPSITTDMIKVENLHP